MFKLRLGKNQEEINSENLLANVKRLFYEENVIEEDIIPSVAFKDYFENYDGNFWVEKDGSIFMGNLFQAWGYNYWDLEGAVMDFHSLFHPDTMTVDITCEFNTSGYKDYKKEGIKLTTDNYDKFKESYIKEGRKVFNETMKLNKLNRKPRNS